MRNDRQAIRYRPGAAWTADGFMPEQRTTKGLHPDMGFCGVP